MSAWQPIEDAPGDGTLRLFWSPLGGPYIAPDVRAESPPRREIVKMIQNGADWPNVGWNPTHWMPLPSPPLSAQDTSGG